MSSSEAAITNATRLDLASGYAPLHDDRPPQLTHPLVPAPWFVSNSADGSIVSNVLDMSAYARMLMRGGDGLLTSEGFARLTAPVVDVPSMPGLRYAYGLLVGDADGRATIRHSGGMIGYTSLLVVQPDDGLACVMLLNGSGDRSATVGFALECVRAARGGGPLPEPPNAPDPAIVSGAPAFAGRYEADGRALDVVAEGSRLELREGEVHAPLLATASPDVFLVADPALDRFFLRFVRDAADEVVEASHGDWRLRRVGAGPMGASAHPVAWRAFPGLYRSNDPWSPVIRVALRGGQLVRLSTGDWEDEPDEVLVPLGDGSFRIGAEPWRPERIRFEDVVEGRAMQLGHDGGTWHRSFEE